MQLTDKTRCRTSIYGSNEILHSFVLPSATQPINHPPAFLQPLLRPIVAILQLTYFARTSSALRATRLWTRPRKLSAKMAYAPRTSAASASVSCEHSLEYAEVDLERTYFESFIRCSDSPVVHGRNLQSKHILARETKQGCILLFIPHAAFAIYAIVAGKKFRMCPSWQVHDSQLSCLCRSVTFAFVG